MTTEALVRAGNAVVALERLDGLIPVASRCNAIVVFAPGFAGDALVPVLRELEDARTGPALIIITDHSVFERRAALRDQPVIISTLADWRQRGLAMLGPAFEASRPELPFTD